jgi:uncharacterized protein (DUF1810 family)
VPMLKENSFSSTNSKRSSVEDPQPEDYWGDCVSIGPRRRKCVSEASENGVSIRSPVLGTLFGAELSFQASIDFEGETGFSRFYCLAGIRGSVVVGGNVRTGYGESGTADKAVPIGLWRSAGMSDSFDLRRFVDAQVAVYRQVVEELSQGRKRTHWMWFVFPQIDGLGFSAMAQRLAIGSRAEAVAYLKHDLLGPRLVECTRFVMAAATRSGCIVQEVCLDREAEARIARPNPFWRIGRS